MRHVPDERVQNRVGEQMMGVPVRHIKEDGLLLVPQERVHNRAAYTGTVFTVKLRHHRDDQACVVDTMGFIKGLDKHTMPRSGDVMVPASQIQEQVVDGQWWCFSSWSARTAASSGTRC